MNRDILLQEAQAIGQNFSFWATDETYTHLFGYVFETPERKFQVDIQFGDTFPQDPPQLFFSDEVLQLLGFPIALETINAWTAESHVVDVLLEIRKKIQDALAAPQPRPQPQPQPQPLPVKPGSSQGASAPTPAPAPAAKPAPPQPATHQPASAAPTVPQQGSLTPAGGEPEAAGDEYVTPDFNAYPVDGMDGVSPEYPAWSEGESENVDASQLPVWGEEETPTPPPASTSPGTASSAPTATPSAPAAQEEASIEVMNQIAEVQQWFAIDVTGPGLIQAYITIPTGQTYFVEVDFHDYPAQPVLTLPPGIADVIGDPYTSFDSLKEWTPGTPATILSVLQELETKLFSLQELETENRMVQGEFDAAVVPNQVGQLSISMLTLGFKKYNLTVDLTPFPARPKIEFSGELKNILTESVEEIPAFKSWKVGTSHVVDVLRDIQWLIEKGSRLDLEIQLLKNSIEDTTMQGNTIRVKMKGQMKTKDLTFEFQVTMPEDYPTSPPDIKLLTDLEAQPDIEEKIKTSMKEFGESWGTFSYLIDLFNKVSKAIFEVSIIKCILCHQIECPQCGKSISEPDGHTACPHCERIYHKHCWEQTIASFKKCGFCMRPP